MAEQVILPKAGSSGGAQKQIIAAFVVIFAVGVVLWVGIKLQERAQNPYGGDSTDTRLTEDKLQRQLQAIHSAYAVSEAFPIITEEEAGAQLEEIDSKDVVSERDVISEDALQAQLDAIQSAQQ